MMTKTQRETAVARKRAAAARKRSTVPVEPVDWDACWDRLLVIFDDLERGEVRNA